MKLKDLSDLLKGSDIIPVPISDKEFNLIENKLSTRFDDDLKSFIRLTNGCYIARIGNKTIECNVIRPGSYEPLNHPITSINIAHVFRYTSNVKDLDGYIKQIESKNSKYKEGYYLNPYKYIPLFEALGEITIFLDIKTKNIIGFGDDGEDLLEDRMIVSNSFRSFIENCKIVDDGITEKD